MVRSIAKQCVSNHEAGVRAACILRDAPARLLRMRRINNRVNPHDLSRSKFSNSHVSFLGRMSGRRTGVHPGSSPGQAFAWTCSAILAAEFRASVRWISLVLPQKRERSAVRRNCLSVLLRGSTCRSCGTSSPYGAPLRCLDGGTPLPRRPAMAITPWPSDDDATEDSIRGSLVSREAFSTRLPGHGLRDHVRGHRTPSTLSRSAERPSANGDRSVDIAEMKLCQ